MSPTCNYRSFLFVPTHKKSFWKKAYSRGSDTIILDLEDSVPVPEKVNARMQLVKALTHCKKHNKPTIVRINQSIRDAIHDLETAITNFTDAILVPKVRDSKHIETIDEIVTELEYERNIRAGNIKIIATLESAEGVLNSARIALSSPRMVALALGPEDLATDLGCAPTEYSLLGACQTIILGARAANLFAIGFPGSISEYQDKISYRKSIEKGRALGFSGAFCIHPDQIEIVNTVFSVTLSEIEWAKKVVSAQEDVADHHSGAFSLDGKMIDEPIIDRAKTILKSIEK
nr:CoA ester lyase [Exilibacterium tricleocarpae]